MCSDPTQHSSISREPGLRSAPGGWRLSWAGGGILAILFAAYFEPIIRLIFTMASEDPNWSHAFLVPFISLYFLRLFRDELRNTPARTALPGLGPFLAGLAIFPAGLFIQSSMVMGYSMILALYGLVWFLHGPDRLRLLRFPVLYLLFGVKITLFWDPIAVRLQRLAAALSASVLNVAGLPLHLEADAEGSVIQLYLHGSAIQPPLNVDEACSGLRMLMALIALGTALAWMERRPLRSRLVLIACTVPLAVAVNVLRISATGLLYPFHPEWTRGAAHEFAGMLMPAAALSVLFLLARWLDRRLPPPPAPKHGEPAPRTPAAGGTAPARPTGLPGSGVSIRALAASVLLLGIGVAGIRSRSAIGRRFLAREAIPPRRPLDTIPARIGPYRMVLDKKLSERAETVLGTRRYISRIYRDTRLPPDAPGAGIWVHVVYYTGSAQTLRIQHTPEQCYVGRGNRPVDSHSVRLRVPAAAVIGLPHPPHPAGPGADGGKAEFPGRIFTFLPRGVTAPISAVYFFIANGRLAGGRRGVRLMALDPRDRYAYYCKVEMVPGRFAESAPANAADAGAAFQPGLPGERTTLRICENFLADFLPAVIACLPDSSPAEAGKIPSVP